MMYRIEYDQIKDSDLDEHFVRVSHNVQYYVAKFLNGKTYLSKGYKVMAISSKTKDELRKLLDDAYLKKIILGKEPVLRQIIKDMPPEAFEKSPYQTNENKQAGTVIDDLNLILYYIFVIGCYENTTLKSAYSGEDIANFKAGSCVDNVNHIECLKLRTCPYCNRNYIYSVDVFDKIKKTQIDHFFPKASFPFLGASFFNLIPSCNYCNSLEVKGDKSPIENVNKFNEYDRIMNPYEFIDDKYKFSIKMSCIDVFNVSKDNILLKILSADNYRVGYQYVFYLESIYEGHKDLIVDLIVRYKVQYPKSNQEFLNSIFDGSRIDDNKINTAFWGFETNTKYYHERSHSKFLNDIYIQINTDPEIRQVIDTL